MRPPGFEPRVFGPRAGTGNVPVQLAVGQAQTVQQTVPPGGQNDSHYYSRLSKVMSSSAHLSKFDGKEKSLRAFKRWRRDVELALMTGQLRREHWGMLLPYVTDAAPKQHSERMVERSQLGGQRDVGYPDYDEAMTSLQAAFVHDELPSEFLQRLINSIWEKGKGQSLSEYLAHLRELAFEAFPDDESQAEKQVKEQFFAGLPSYLVGHTLAIRDLSMDVIVQKLSEMDKLLDRSRNRHSGRGDASSGRGVARGARGNGGGASAPDARQRGSPQGGNRGEVSSTPWKGNRGGGGGGQQNQWNQGQRGRGGDRGSRGNRSFGGGNPQNQSSFFERSEKGSKGNRVL